MRSTSLIQPAFQEDHKAIVALWEDSVRATHHFLDEATIEYFKPLILNEFLHAVELYCTKNEAGNITGFLGVADRKVEMLFIHPSQSGKGIGKQLLQFAIQKLKTNAVDVNEQNEQAVGFYKHMGFVVVNRSETDSMGKPFPLLHMELPYNLLH
jgi:putative acetyltransferase